MAHFIVRTHGNDLKNLKHYNNADWSDVLNDYTNNSFFPEFAPKSVGGTMSGVPYKDSKGNCTWYAFGRYLEVHGIRPKKPHMRPDAKYWGTNGEQLSSTPQVGGIVVFGDSSYGHVAFTEKIVGNDVIVSESSYSTRGNDFLFRYQRTVEQIKKEWGMTVLRYIAPPTPSTSFDNDEVEVAQNGVFISTEVNGSNIRKTPSEKSARVGGISKGEKIAYSAYIDAEGYRWIKTNKGYIARRKLDQSAVYGNASLVVNNPPIKPNKVGKVLVVRHEDYKKVEFTAYADKACTKPFAPWTANKDLKFMITEDHDPVFKCKQYGTTPMGGTKFVYIKWESGIGFE